MFYKGKIMQFSWEGGEGGGGEAREGEWRGGEERRVVKMKVPKSVDNVSATNSNVWVSYMKMDSSE